MAENYSINIDVTEKGLEDIQGRFDSLRDEIKETEKAIDKLTKTEGKSFQERKHNQKVADELRKKLAGLNLEYDGLSKVQTDLNAGLKATGDEMGSLQVQINNSVRRLEALSLAGEQGSKEFQDLTQHVNDLKSAQSGVKDMFKETKESIEHSGGAVHTFEGAVEGVAGALEVSAVAMSAFGMESEDVHHKILMVQQAMALAEGIKNIQHGAGAFKDMGASAVKALKGIKTGLLATGIGLFVVALGTVVAYWDDITHAVGLAGHEQEGYNEVLDATTSEMTSLFEELINVDIAFEQAREGTISKKEALDIYNDTLGDSIGQADNLAEAERLYASNTDAYIEATMARVQAQALIQMAAKERAEATRKQNEAEVNGVLSTFEKIKAFTLFQMGLYTEAADDIIENSGTRNIESAENFEKQAKELLKTQKDLEKKFNINADKSSKRRHRTRRKNHKTRVKDFIDVEERIFKLQNEFNNKRIHNIFRSAKHQYEKERIDILNNERIKQEDKEKLILALDENWKKRYAKILEDDRRREVDYEHGTQMMLLNLKEQTRESEIAILEKQREQEKEIMQRKFDDGEMTMKEFSERSIAMGEVGEKKLADINAKYDKIEFDKQDEQFKLLNELKETDREKEITALVESYEAKFEIAEGNAVLEIALQESLNKELEKLKDKHRKEEDKKDKEQVERKRVSMMQQLDIAHAGLGAIGDLVNALAGENEKSARRAFNINKAVGIAQAVISTAQGIMKAMAETTDVTPTQSLRFANALAVGIAGVAQVATIAKQKFQTTGSGGGGGDIPTPSSSGGSAQPSFNVVGSSGVNQLAELQMQPTQAFVVSGDITTAQSLDRNKIENATI